ncbi:MAG: oxaloacetate decarboxylase [Clostridia bacterium]|nr:oxaloacetate decarboxylase [Clostridia bacterium]
MGVGLLGVFMIIGIIIASTYAIAKLTAPKNNNK